MAKSTAKKVEENAASASSDIKNYAHQIWLAGLGAYAKAGKDSMDYFKTLVVEGEVIEKQGKELFSEHADNASEKLAELKSRFEDFTGGPLKKSSHSLEERRTEFLSRFGIPSSHEIEKLSSKLDEVSKSLKKA